MVRAPSAIASAPTLMLCGEPSTRSLGRNPQQSLDDTDFEFLRAHWIIYLWLPDKDEADPLTQFLLNRHFTTERLDTGELTLDDIQAYADSLQVSARVWQRLHFPEDHGNALGAEPAAALARLKRLGFGVLRPLLLSALIRDPKVDEIIALFEQSERFLLLVRSFTAARGRTLRSRTRNRNGLHDVNRKSERVLDAARNCLRIEFAGHFNVNEFQSTVDDLFAPTQRREGLLRASRDAEIRALSGIRGALAKGREGKLPSEDRLGRFSRARGTPWETSVFPQSPAPGVSGPPVEPYTSPRNSGFSSTRWGTLWRSQLPRNASLSRHSFSEKKKGTENVPGFAQGSYSELLNCTKRRGLDGGGHSRTRFRTPPVHRTTVESCSG